MVAFLFLKALIGEFLTLILILANNKGYILLEKD
jgi:hypothetical protein